MAVLERLTRLALQHPILAAIPPELTSRRGVHQCLTPGELLYRSGDSADGIYFLLAGALQIEYPKRGAVRGRAITIVLAPGVLGECQTIYRRAWSGTGVALTELDVITFDRTALFDLLLEQPAAAKALYCELAWQFLGAIDRRRVEPVLEPEDQIRNYLLDLRAVFASPGDAHPWLPVTQSDLARACSLRRETVARLLTRWRASKKVDSRRGQIRLNPAFARRRPKHLVSIISRAHDPNAAH